MTPAPPDQPEGGNSEYAATPTTAGSNVYAGGEMPGPPPPTAPPYASPYAHTPQPYGPPPSAIPRMPQVTPNLPSFQSGCYGIAPPSSALWV